MGVWAILQVVETGQRRWYLISGLQIGALGAVRLNDLALGLVLMVGHMARERNWQGSLRQLCAGRLWLAGPYSSAVFSNASANNSRK